MVFYKEVRNMKKKTVLVIGIVGILLVFGAVVALAQNASEKTKDAEDHECTPEMMKDMSKNCPEQMMHSEENDHCGGMDSDMSSMMGSVGKKSMM